MPKINCNEKNRKSKFSNVDSKSKAEPDCYFNSLKKEKIYFSKAEIRIYKTIHLTYSNIKFF